MENSKFVRGSWFYFLFLVALICGLLFFFWRERSRPFRDLEKDTMAVHDEAMKEMAEMNRVARALKKDPAVSDTAAASAARKTQIAEVLKQIEKADADMMDWMKNYKSPDRTVSREVAIGYLREEKMKIVQNQKDIRAAIEAGKKLLEK